MDRTVFAGRGPFVGLDDDNRGLTTASDLDDALRWTTEHVDIVTVAGRLRPEVQAADVDPADTGADPEAGEAAAEELVDWCADQGFPWLLRASGRPGGRHVFAVVPADLAGEWTSLCARVRRHHGVGCTPRRTLRLLQAPHRLGLPAPVVAGTLTPADLTPSSPGTATSANTPPRPHSTVRRKKKPCHKTGIDRSRGEFGDTLARVRAGWTPGRAWAAVSGAGSKAAEMGEPAWRRWVWAKAVTVVAAEDGAAEAEAWQRFELAAPARAHQLGRAEWREQYWLPAVDEAQQPRPRRRRTDRASAAAPQPVVEREEQQQRELGVVRAGLRRAGEEQIALAGRRPQFARSLQAVLDAVAEVIVSRDGSISERAWAEAAHVDRKTVRRCRDFAVERGILDRAAAYQGGADSSAAWRPGPVAISAITEIRKTSPTRYTTPRPPTHGTANPEKLRRRHTRERQAWRLRCQLSTSTETTGEAYRDRQDPAAKALRSLWFQRRWWQSLTPDEQEQRRAHRRSLLGEMHQSQRSAWFDWLARRATIMAAADRVEAHQARPDDHQVLTAAPRTIHRGLRDPNWRTGGTSPCPAEVIQLELFTTAPRRPSAGGRRVTKRKQAISQQQRSRQRFAV